jgi:hypothetical protein
MRGRVWLALGAFDCSEHPTKWRIWSRYAPDLTLGGAIGTNSHPMRCPSLGQIYGHYRRATLGDLFVDPCEEFLEVIAD